MESCRASLKGTEGRLLLAADRLVWTAADDSQQIAIPFDQVKLLEVNPAGNVAKVLLKITPSESTVGLEKAGYLFNFAANMNAVEVRDQVKERLARCIADHRQRAPAPSTTVSQQPSPVVERKPLPEVERLAPEEIKARGMLLAQDPSLHLLHRQLVVSEKVMGEEEFWSARRPLVEGQKAQLLQERGIAPITQQEVRQSQDSHTSLKLTLTPQLIQTIFAQFPAVYRAYRDNVPEKIREKDFWVQYFTSQYFTGSSTEGSVFDEYFQQEEHLINQEQIERINNLTLNEPENQLSTEEEARTRNSAVALIKNFNIQSANILNSFLQEKQKYKQKILHTPQLKEEHSHSLIVEKTPPETSETNESKIGLLLHRTMTSKEWETKLSPLFGLKVESDSKSSNALNLHSERVLLVKEYLRHFWANYPPKGNQDRRTKINKLVPLLQNLQSKIAQQNDSSELQLLPAIENCLLLAGK